MKNTAQKSLEARVVWATLVFMAMILLVDPNFIGRYPFWVMQIIVCGVLHLTGIDCLRYAGRSRPAGPPAALCVFWGLSLVSLGTISVLPMVVTAVFV
jgi:hypothetical protein